MKDELVTSSMSTISFSILHPSSFSLHSLVRRHYLTLIEVVIVLAVLSIAIGVVGINLSRLAQQEKFRAGTEFLVDRLQLAQDIMILFGEDVKVLLTKDAGGMQFKLEMDPTQLIGTALSNVTRTQNIPGINAFVFSDTHGAIQTDKVELFFMSRGTRMSQGDLMLTAQPGDADVTRYITLTGYPQAIRSASTPTQKQLEPELSTFLYPTEVRQNEQKPNAPD